MAFVKKTWKDRIVQYANRRLLTKSGGEVEQVIVTRDEGTVTEAGDKFDAATMNDLEDRLEYAFDNVSTAIECTQAEYDTWKNAGQLKLQTTYIIKDAPNLNATASDIEYSGGVSVADALDDFTVTTGTCSLNTTNTTSGNVSYSKSGKVVAVGGYFFTKGTWNATSKPVVILPYKVASQSNPIAQTVINGDTNKATYLNVVANTYNVNLDYSNSDGQLVRFSFTYITNE